MNSRLILSFLLLIFTHLVHSQEPDRLHANQQIGDTIYYNYSTRELVFKDQTKSYMGCAASISPNKNLAAIAKFAKQGESYSNVHIFNQYGDEINSFRVHPLDKLAVSDDGRIAMYGFEPTYGIPITSKLMLYSDEGKLLYENDDLSFSINHYGVFSDDNQLYVFIATGEDVFRDPCSVHLLIFNEEFKQIGGHVFTDWKNGSPITRPIITDSTILVKRWSGKGNYLFDETLNLDYEGKLIN